MKTEAWFIKTVKRISSQEALGSGRTEDFCWGMIRGWYAAGLISRRFYNELLDNYLEAQTMELAIEGEQDLGEILQRKYGRILF